MFRVLLAAAVAVAQESYYADYPSYDYGTEAPGTDAPTTIQSSTARPFTTAATTVQATAGEILNDFVATDAPAAAEEEEEVVDMMGRSLFNGFPQQRNAPVEINSISNLSGELQADQTFKIKWETDVTHTKYD